MPAPRPKPFVDEPLKPVEDEQLPYRAEVEPAWFVGAFVPEPQLPLKPLRQFSRQVQVGLEHPPP